MQRNRPPYDNRYRVDSDLSFDKSGSEYEDNRRNSLPDDVSLKMVQKKLQFQLVSKKKNFTERFGNRTGGIKLSSSGADFIFSQWMNVCHMSQAASLFPEGYRTSVIVAPLQRRHFIVTRANYPVNTGVNYKIGSSGMQHKSSSIQMNSVSANFQFANQNFMNVGAETEPVVVEQYEKAVDNTVPTNPVNRYYKKMPGGPINCMYCLNLYHTSWMCPQRRQPRMDANGVISTMQAQDYKPSASGAVPSSVDPGVKCMTCQSIGHPICGQEDRSPYVDSVYLEVPVLPEWAQDTLNIVAD